jgi:hypothetical protein
MKKILYFDLHSMQNQEFSQFTIEFSKLIILYTATKLGIVTLSPAFQTLLDELAKALQAEKGSVYTKSITQSDAYRDQLEHGFYLFIECCLYHYDPAVQTAAEHIQRILDKYGDLRRLPYNKESGAITNRNTELMNNYTAEITTVGASEWLSKDNNANNEFINHFGDRANELAARITSNVRESRIKVQESYDAIVTRINALSEVNGDAEYAEFIDKVNYFVDYYKTTLAARKGRQKVVPAVPAEPAK